MRHLVVKIIVKKMRKIFVDDICPRICCSLRKHGKSSPTTQRAFSFYILCEHNSYLIGDPPHLLSEVIIRLLARS